MGADGVAAEIEEDSPERGDPLEGLYSLLGGDQAHRQVTPAVTILKAVALGVITSEEPVQTATPPADGPEPHNPLQLPASQQVLPLTFLPYKPNPQLRRQTKSAEHPGPLPPMESHEGEVLRDPPRLVQP